MKLLIATTLCLMVASLVPAADDKPIERPPVKHRVTGLFSPDREADLKKVFAEKIPEAKLVSVDFKNSEATFVYDADVLFIKPTPEQLIERFDNLLRTHTQGTFGIRDVCKTPKDKLSFIEIGVVGLDCKGCCLAVYETIYRIDGVEQATASFKEGLVTAWIDSKKTDRAILEEALKKRGVTLSAP
ncbi:MAG: heavy metal-associated domain-containing protein [Planctomycetia bacterium]|nr:heavy metal-associated domain-containing protein [Planctomycetia bacterium]